MRRLGAMLCAALVGLAVSTAPTFAQDGERWSVAAPSDWIEVFAIESLLAERELDALLLERQSDLRGESPESYVRVVHAFADTTDVQEGSQLAIDFDPDYQELLLHEAVLWRGDQRLDALSSARFDLLQRQTSLEQRIYDGTHTLLVLLEDVRLGDVLDYSFTVRGENPVLDGHFLSRLDTRWSEPVAAYRYRLLSPAEVEVFTRGHGPVPEPVVRDVEGGRELVWSGSDVPALIVDSDVPSWYDPFPWVQVSTVATWEDVVRWGIAQYPRPERLSDDLAQEVEAIRAAHATPEARTLAALRFVQDEIRYLGITIGTGSHRPSAPDEVLRRRFGDCKDKALLLVSMLEALDVPAAVALVSTTYREHIRDWHPSPFAFDHAIVRARLGRDVWLDGTMLHQRGGLSDVEVDFLGAALVLEQGATAPVTIDLVRPIEPTTRVRVDMELGGVDVPVRMTVSTKYAGQDAQAFRYDLIGTTPEERTQAYLNYYSRFYPSVESRGPVEVDDDTEADVVTIRERYELSDFWVESDGQHVGELIPLELLGFFAKPVTLRRTMPLGLAHPVDARVEISARFGEGWQVSDEHDQVDSSGMELVYDASVHGDELLLSWSYRSLADSVAPEDCRAHLDALDRAEDLMSYPIQAPGGFEGAPAMGLLVACGAVSLFLALIAAVLVFFLNPGPRPPEVVLGGEPVGIGGWLVLVAIGVCAQPLSVLTSAPDTMAVFDPEVWGALSLGSDGEVRWSGVGYVCLGVAGFGALIVGSVLQIAAFFARKRCFAPVFIAMRVIDLTSGAAWILASSPVTDVTPTEIPRLTGGTISAVLWTLYVLRSRRVRNTFVR